MRLRVASLLIIVLITATGVLAARVPQLHIVQDAASWVLSPVQWVMSGPAAGIGAFVYAFGEASEVRQDNLRLQEEVGRLQQETARLAELEREVEDLRQYLGLKEAFADFQFIEAGVIGSDPSNLVRAITINRGTDQGVKEGMTVVTPAGLVGRVVKVSPVAARVLLLTDISNSVTAIAQDSRAHGVVNGERTQYLTMKYISQSYDLRVGEKVITSGMGGIYPPGILIGDIVSVSKKDTDIFQEARIQPIVPFGSLERVLVITNHVPVKLVQVDEGW